MPDNNFSNRIKKLKIKRIIYPAIFTILIISLIIIFVSSARFLSQNLNKAFVSPNEKTIESQLIKIDLANYNLVIKKLGIKNEPTPAPETIQPITSPATTTEIQQPAPTSTIQYKNKTVLKIEILNSAKPPGLAADLKTLLTNSGFMVEKTGNQSAAEEITLVKVRDSEKNSPAINELSEIVSKKYTSASIQTLEETNEFDVIIVIGKK